ncbi:MAG: site-2 protease family protein [Oscillospiraceae bacterium]|nr:site-2 protease family protein [Oscillospiraceae bacterium]
MIVLYILLAVLIFGVLILTHELGHFITAKLFGVRVNEFSICMGPAIFRKTVGETTYALRCIPIGGYCAMEGEDEHSDDPRSFTGAKAWKRAIILAAGSAMNFLTGLLILLVMYCTIAGTTTTKIEAFFPECPLERADRLQVGDVFHRIDGRRVYLYSDVAMLLSRDTDGLVDLEVKRDGNIVALNDLPMQKQAYEVDGETVYRYGLYFGYEEMSIGSAFRYAWYSALDHARMVWMSLSDLIKGLVSVEDMSGPVGIVSVIAQTGKASETAGVAALNISYLGAFIAVNLAVMNLLPIPALDGGRIFFLLITTVIEKTTRRKIDPKYEGYIHAAGMVLLLAFIAFITLKDIWKLIGH